MHKKLSILILLVLIFACLSFSSANAQIAVPKITVGVEESSNPSDFALTIQIVLLMTILSLAPSILIMMTSFTRLIIVFHFLRNALATQSAPSNQILIGLALFITLFVMKPVLDEIYTEAFQPYLQEEVTLKEALTTAEAPIKKFMLKQTREKDIELFVKLQDQGQPKAMEDLSLAVVIPSFIISELKTAFQIGFLLYLPMLMIDVIVASVLLSMGMMMLPPVMISMPFKILLFVLVDGWYLLVESLVKGFA